MPTYEIDGPGGKIYSIDGPPDMSRDQVVAAIKRRLPQQETTHAISSPWEMAKDIGRGAVRGIARGTQQLLDVVPNLPPPMAAGRSYEDPQLLGEAGPQTQQALQKKLTEHGPQQFTEKRVAPPETPIGVAAEYVGEAIPTAPLQPGGPITKAVTTIGAGLGEFGGEAAAIEMGLPPGLGRFIGGFLGGGITGGGAQVAAERRARGMLPTSQANRVAAQGAYQQIENARLVVDPSEAQNFATGLRADLDRNLFSPQPGGRGNVAFHAADLIERTDGDLATLMNVHSRLGAVTPGEGANYAAAQLARDEIREWIGNLQPNQVVAGDPQFTSGMWQHAIDSWRTHSNLEDIQNALQSAEWRRLVSGQGRNLNTLRQEIRKIIDSDKNARKYSAEARAAMENVVEGDLARNVMRHVAAFAPTGAVSSLPTVITAATHGTGAGAAIAVPAFIMHLFRGYLEERSVQQLLDVVREGSPLLTGPQRRARATLLAPGRTSVGAARGALAAGADSPLAEGPGQE
jgi:hypothetical protein